MVRQSGLFEYGMLESRMTNVSMLRFFERLAEYFNTWEYVDIRCLHVILLSLVLKLKVDDTIYGDWQKLYLPYKI